MKKQAMMVVIVLAAVGAMVPPGAGRPMAAQQPDPAAVLQRLSEAISNGDLAAAMELFTDDAVFLGGPTCFPTACLGRAAIEREMTTEIAGHTQVMTTSLGSDGNLVTGRSEIREDATHAAGVERITEGFVAVIRDGRVASLVTTLDVTDPQTLRFLAFVSQSPPPATPASPADAGGGQ
jgi:ketosteroid isomerase-like protein